MARDVESLVLRMSADLRRFEKSMDSMRQTADRRLNEVERRALKSQRNLSRTMEQAGADMVSGLQRSLAALAPTLAAAFSTQAVVRYADAWTAGRNALAAAGVATEDLARVQGELVDLASETRTGAAETISLYQRLSIATAELGMTQQDTLRLTELLNKSFQSSGLSTQEAASAALQLSQALASGSLQGDELRSLRENAPLVAKAIADSMGVGIGALKDLGAEGKITADVIVSALFGASEQINSTFAATSATVGQALTVLNNELGRFVGEADSGLSATERLAQGIVALANNLDRILPVATTLAVLVGGRYAIGMTAAAVQTGLATVEAIRYQAALIGLQARQTGATAAQVALNAAIRANPIGLAITLVTGLAAGVYLLSQRYNEASKLQREIASTAKAADDALSAYEEAARAAAVATGDNAKAARDNVAAMRAEAVTALQAAQALRERTAALAASRAQEAQEAEARFFQSNGGKGAIEARGGQLALASAAARTAERRAADARREADEAQRELARIDANIRDGSYVPTPITKTGDDKAKTTRRGGRDSADQIARARAELDLERQIALARASGDEAALRAAEERQELARLISQYEAAGYEDARAAAIEHLGWINEATRAAEERERIEQEIDDLVRASERRNQRRLEVEQLLNDQLLDRLGYEATLARLGGSEGAVRDAERRLWVEERINELLRLRPGLSRDDARNQAITEADALDAAERGRDMARSFVDILASDDWARAAGDRFREAAFDGLENLLAQIFSNMGGGKDGGILGAIFGGFRASGGPVSAGRAYVVGEKRPELFIPSTSGTIIPSVNAAMAGMGGRAGGGQTFVVNVNASDAVLTETVRGWVREGMQQAVQTSTSIARRSAPGMQQQQRRLGTT